MFHPTFKLSEVLDAYRGANVFFNIVQIGAGGNGGYLVQRLTKLLHALSQKDITFSFTYKIIDGDQVEVKNLQRQPFIEDDVGMFKAQVLAERYQAAYGGLPVLYKNEYVETAKDIEQLVYMEQPIYKHHVPIILGCVDNNATRQLIHEAFQKIPNCIYIDSGIESMDEEGSVDSGYSGQVVCGARMYNKQYLEPIGEVYPNILEDKDSRLPTQACGEQVANYPQRMQTNETAALVMMGYLNTLLSEHALMSHYTNFNARTMLIRPTYIQEGQVKS